MSVGAGHRIRDGLILAAHRLRRASAGRSRVIALHDVPDPILFRDKMEWLRGHFHVVPLHELQAGAGSGQPRVALTFDDGYADWHRHAAPVLIELALPATFFVCSGYVGLDEAAARRFRHTRMRRQRESPPLSLTQLRELAREPAFRIGSHTADHVDLGKVTSRAVLEAQIGDDRARLQDWTAQEVDVFAFPFGQRSNASPEAVRYLQSAGFERGFTIVPEPVEGARSPFLVGRDSLDLEASPRLWAAWLAGAYDGIYRWKNVLLGNVRRS